MLSIVEIVHLLRNCFWFLIRLLDDAPLWTDALLLLASIGLLVFLLRPVSLLRMLLFSGIGSFVAAAAFYAGLFVLQRSLLYPGHRFRVHYGAPSRFELPDFSEVDLTAKDGVRIVGWAHHSAQNRPTILYLHGNGDNLAHLAPRFRNFAADGYGVFALEYRGYGDSDGTPSEDGLYEDARSAIGWLQSSDPTGQIIVYGESLGSGVAVEMAEEQHFLGVVLESPYTSVADRASEMFWFLPGVRYLVRDRFASIDKIASIHSPILILHGDRDTVIPIAEGRKLAATATAPTRFIAVRGAGHWVTDDTVIKAMDDFFYESQRAGLR
ncbi:MAG TPA: alpha/beta hydrolase [Candidatus Binataceae bacterium]|nr:alpha/beta hydrolase [Candidatus Binataceae bacterium]